MAPRRASYPSITPTVPASHYASMYDTLSRRWGQRAEELADHGEFARTSSGKRTVESIDADLAVDGAPSPPSKRRRAESVAVAGLLLAAAGEQAVIHTSEKSTRSTARPVSHQRSTSSPAVLVLSPSPATSPSLVAPSPFDTPGLTGSGDVPSNTIISCPSSIIATEPLAKAPSSLPTSPIPSAPVPSAPINPPGSANINLAQRQYSLLVRSPSASTNNSVARAEALIKVVRSFEVVLHYRADGWRVFGEAVKGGASSEGRER